MTQTTTQSESELHFYPELHQSFLARARYHGFPEELIVDANKNHLDDFRAITN